MNKNNASESQNRKKKEAIVAEVAEKVGKAKAMVFTNFSGLTHKQLEEFKKEIKKLDADFAATKNTLLKRALEQTQNEKLKTQNLEETFKEHFHQPTGTLFMYGDVVAPLKTLAKMIKDFEKPTVKFGLLEGKAMTDKEVLKLSTLPSREVLLTQLVVMMKSPIQGLHRSLHWNLQKFVMTLDAVAKSKSQATSNK